MASLKKTYRVYVAGTISVGTSLTVTATSEEDARQRATQRLRKEGVDAYEWQDAFGSSIGAPDNHPASLDYDVRLAADEG